VGVDDRDEFGPFDGHVAFLELLAEWAEAGGTGFEGHVGMGDCALEGLDLGKHLILNGVLWDFGRGAVAQRWRQYSQPCTHGNPGESLACCRA
jgi:hypothetical protein